jgi:tetratricopeptide (TPR) repeat protein
MSKRWQKVELAYLKKHAGDKSLAHFAGRFHTDEGTVATKLEELRGGGAAAAAAVVDSVEHFTDGMAALYAGEWERAASLLEGVTDESSPDLAARARQFAAVARQRLAEAPPEDPWLRAVFEKNRGRYADALQICDDGERSATDGRFAYLAAVLHTLQGDLDRGQEHLERAIALDPHNRAHALHDLDLRPLRERAEPGDAG